MLTKKTTARSRLTGRKATKRMTSAHIIISVIIIITFFHNPRPCRQPHRPTEDLGQKAGINAAISFYTAPSHQQHNHNGQPFTHRRLLPIRGGISSKPIFVYRTKSFLQMNVTKI
jgi:hypothetical protein